MSEKRMLNPELLGDNGEAFRNHLQGVIVGQAEAVDSLVEGYQIAKAGLSGRGPVRNYLFLGPTGVGKTRVVEAAGEFLFQDTTSLIRVDCAEFQHSHEVAKIIGSPPGYVGFREVAPIFSRASLESLLKGGPPGLVLFDEIEKANRALWDLLLGILDQGRLRLGDTSQVSFQNIILVMTGNIAAREFAELVEESAVGFRPKLRKVVSGKQIGDKAMKAAKRLFSPEFLNRIHRTVVFRNLTPQEIEQVLEVELKLLQKRIIDTTGVKFSFSCSDSAKRFLIERGYSLEYGARHLRRAIETHLVLPLANLMCSGQVALGDRVLVDCHSQDGLSFAKEAGKLAIGRR